MFAYPAFEINDPDQSFPLSVLIGRGSKVEIINLSTLQLRLSFPNRGICWQEARSKCIFPLIGEQQGTQTMTISAIKVNPVIGLPTQSFLVNTYEEGEIDLYAPVSLGSTETQLFTNTAYASISGSGTLTITNNSADGFIFLWGFDIENGHGGTVTEGALLIDGLQVNGGTGTIQYEVQSVTAGTFSMSRRFDPPLASVADTDIVFTTPVTATGPTPVWKVKAFWTQSFMD